MSTTKAARPAAVSLDGLATALAGALDKSTCNPRGLERQNFHTAPAGVSRRLFAIADNVDTEPTVSISFDKTTGNFDNIRAAGEGS